MIYKFLDKTSTSTSTHTGTEINFENQQLGEELHKPIIRKFKKVCLSFKQNIWGADLAHMQLKS